MPALDQMRGHEIRQVQYRKLGGGGEEVERDFKVVEEIRAGDVLLKQPEGCGARLPELKPILPWRVGGPRRDPLIGIGHPSPLPVQPSSTERLQPGEDGRGKRLSQPHTVESYFPWNRGRRFSINAATPSL
jgi:hypothetical protein